MRDFARELEQRLSALAIDPRLWPVAAPEFAVVRLPAPVRSAPANATRAWPRRRQPRLAIGAFASATIVVGATVLVTGSSTDQLPILGTATSDASALASNPVVKQLGVSLDEAHEVRGAAGTAYVLSSTDHDRVCLVIPDPNMRAGEGYGGGCRATATVEREGLLVEAIGVRNPGSVTKNAIGFVLPIGASHPVIVDGNSRRIPAVDHGVIAEVTHGGGVLSYTLASSRHRVTLHPPFAATNGPCDPGHGQLPPPKRCP